MVSLLDPLEPLTQDISWIKNISAQPEKFVKLDSLSEILKKTLKKLGIKKIYNHQLRCYELLSADRDAVITTPAASGKSLAYQMPLVDLLATEPLKTALFLFPTKALTRDQAAKLTKMLDAAGIAEDINIYDGDTPKKLRKPLRGKGRILFTNPDMLHVTILPNHHWWSRFFAGLSYLVVDELHVYNGIFGSHFANVMRRLEAVANHYQSSYNICVTSATISNPSEHARLIFNREFVVVNDSGAYEPKRYLVGVDPGPEFYLSYAAWLIKNYLDYDMHLLTFVRTKRECELLLNLTRKELENCNKNPNLVAGYRSGYLDSERRKIEKDFQQKKIEGIITTSALELGIDIGHLQVVIVVGFPRSIASFWQQIGRAGRSGGSALAIFVATRNPIDHFLLRNPDYFFKPPEHAVIDPENIEVRKAHQLCGSYELPENNEQDLEMLIRGSGRTPAQNIDLRSSSGSIILMEGQTVVGKLERTIAPLFLHPGAVYLHQGKSYIVKKLSLRSNVAIVKSEDVGYFTEAITETRIAVEKNLDRRDEVSLDSVQLNMRLKGYRKIGFDDLDVIDQVPIDFEMKEYQTTALSIKCSDNKGLLFPILQVARLFVLSIPGKDLLGGYFDSGIFLYDAYPGGVGITRELFKNLPALIDAAYRLVEGCPCPSGCPSCIGKLGDKKDIVRNLKMLKVNYA